MKGASFRAVQEDLIINEIEAIRDTVPGFYRCYLRSWRPDANMYMLRCKSPRAEQTCRRLSQRLSGYLSRAYGHQIHEPTINLTVAPAI